VDWADVVEIREDFDKLGFETLPIDAREPSPSYPAEWQRVVSLPQPARDAFVVQFAAPPRPSWLTELRAAGVTPIDYVPQNGYVVLADQAALDQATASLPIQIARLHQPIHKVSAAIRSVEVPFVNAEIAIAEVPEAAEATALLAQNTLTRLRPPEFIGDRTYHRVTVVADSIRQLAALPATLWIDTYGSPSPSGQREAHLTLGSPFVADTSGILKPVLGDHRQWLADPNRGVANYKTALKLAILDTGFDTAFGDGVPSDVHPDFKNASGNSFVEVRRYTNLAGSNADCNGHGTMVAGVLAGNAGAPPRTQTKDVGSQYSDFDYYMGLGILPEMPIIVGRVFNLLSSTGTSGCAEPPPPGSALCFDPQERHIIYGDLFNRGVRIVSNSWNRSQEPAYTAEAQIQDRIVRSADGTDSGPPTPMVIYFSAGNAEFPAQNQPLVSSPATAKNVITVGGTENFNPIPYDDPLQYTGGEDASNGNELWSVSQRGPTADGRIKPDLVTPASAIESPRSRTTSSCRVGAVGEGIDDDIDDGQVSPIGQQHYWSRGTSFAAPLAAGAGALLYTWFKNNTGTDPKPSLLKAMQITLAKDLSPFTGHPPDSGQGWGKADLTRAFDPQGGYVWNNEGVDTLLTSSGQPVEFPAGGGQYQIKDTIKPVKVTLVWTDDDGTPGADNALVNNLDLTIDFQGTGGAGKFALGNDFNTDTGLSNIRTSPGGPTDTRNNVEQVVFTFPGVGADRFKVKVIGTSITADGVNVWTGTTPQQNFAFFIENALLVPLGATRFHTLIPCRVVDTRGPPGPYGGPALVSGQARIFAIRGPCGIPSTAKAVSVNLTAVQPSGDGYLTAYRSDIALPAVSSMNYRANGVRANNAVVTLDGAGQMSIFASFGGPHLLLDVNGYFE
jgi:hypothetical protein